MRRGGWGLASILSVMPNMAPDTPKHSQASLGQSLVGSLLLSAGSWGKQSFVCVLQESVSTVLCRSCVSSGGSMVGLMVTSSKRAYAIPKSATPRVPAHMAGQY